MNQHVHIDNKLVFPDTAGTVVDERKFFRSIKIVGIVTGLGAILTMLLVIVIDPYHLFRIVDRAGFNRIKPLPELYREQIR